MQNNHNYMIYKIFFNYTGAALIACAVTANAQGLIGKEAAGEQPNAPAAPSLIAPNPEPILGLPAPGAAPAESGPAVAAPGASVPAAAAAEPAPPKPAAAPQTVPIPPDPQGLAHIEVTSGEVDYVSEHTRTPAAFGLSLRAGDGVLTKNKGRARVVMNNGDIAHLAPGSELRVNVKDGNTVIVLRRGQAVFYAMPSLEGRGGPLVVLAPEGTLIVNTGKAGLVTQKDKTEVLVFDNSAMWFAKNKEQTLYAGQALEGRGATWKLLAFPADRDQGFHEQTSPEAPAVQQALALYRGKDLAAAKDRFAEVHTSYPYNGAATYHLGLIQLDQGNIPDAVHQWKRYAQVDPAGAKKTEVKRHISQLVTQQIKQEVKDALANEDKISKATPEPNSLAVHPLKNKGRDKHKAIGKGLTAMVIADIAKVPNIKVLEREKVDRLLEEIKLSQSGLVSKETEVRAGRLLRAEKLVVGDYKVDTATGKTGKAGQKDSSATAPAAPEPTPETGPSVPAQGSPASPGEKP